jgi:hypothetical protein
VLVVERRARLPSASSHWLDDADRVSESSVSPLAVGAVGWAVLSAPCNARRSGATGCTADATLAGDEGEEGRGGVDVSVRGRCAARLVSGLVSRCASAWGCCCSWARGLTGVAGCARLVEGLRGLKAAGGGCGCGGGGGGGGGDRGCRLLLGRRPVSCSAGAAEADVDGADCRHGSVRGCAGGRCMQRRPALQLGHLSAYARCRHGAGMFSPAR